MGLFKYLTKEAENRRKERYSEALEKLAHAKHRLASVEENKIIREKEKELIDFIKRLPKGISYCKSCGEKVKIKGIKGICHICSFEVCIKCVIECGSCKRKMCKTCILKKPYYNNSGALKRLVYYCNNCKKYICYDCVKGGIISDKCPLCGNKILGSVSFGHEISWIPNKGMEK